ncbi:hypothetical protein GASC598I20_002660, partial [Gilliamella apicola SCGC AB-598-I20]
MVITIAESFSQYTTIVDAIFGIG